MPILWKHFSITEILWLTFWRNIDDPLLTLWIYCTIQTNKNSYFSWAALLVCWYSTLWLVEKAVFLAYFCCNIVLADCCTLVHLWNSIDVFNLTSWLFFESSKLREEKKIHLWKEPTRLYSSITSCVGDLTHNAQRFVLKNFWLVTP